MSVAYKAGVDAIRPVKPDTIAKSLAIGNPADGYYAYRAVKDSGGHGEHATDEEIVLVVRWVMSRSPCSGSAILEAREEYCGFSYFPDEPGVKNAVVERGSLDEVFTAAADYIRSKSNVIEAAR